MCHLSTNKLHDKLLPYGGGISYHRLPCKILSNDEILTSLEEKPFIWHMRYSAYFYE